MRVSPGPIAEVLEERTPAMLEPETMLGDRYRVTGVLAQGGMGVVYRAEDERLLRPVAVKTPGRDEEHLVLRLRREARLLARLSHPNIVRLFDVVEHDGQPYLVSELVDGVPLRNLLGEMSAERIAEVGAQIAAALAAAHAVGIIHRDLKPSNVLVADRARLLDFGIARQKDDTTLTNAQGIVGTASYLAPEQLSGTRATPASDIYALGLVLVECFSGRSAFPGTLATTVTMRLMGPPELPASMPAAWHPLIEELLDPDPAHRPPAGAVAARLQGLAAGEAVPVPWAPDPATVTANSPVAADATALMGASSSPVPTPVPRSIHADADADTDTGSDPGTAAPVAPAWLRAMRRTAVPVAAVVGAVAGSLLVAILVRPDTPAAPAAGADVTTTVPVAAVVTTGPPGGAGVARRGPASPSGDANEPAPADEPGAEPESGGGDGGPSPAPSPGGGGGGPSGGGNAGGGGRGNGGGAGAPPTTTPRPTTPPSTTNPGGGGGGGDVPVPTTVASDGAGLLAPVNVVLEQLDQTVGDVTAPLL